MNIKEKLTCKHCNELYNQPITLSCGDTICKHHIEELVSGKASNKFLCPLCDKEILNQDFTVNKIIQDLIQVEFHEFKLNPKYENIFQSLKMEIRNLETILRDPQNCIYEEMSELKRQVDLEKESLKSEIDKLADGLIQQLETYEDRFKSEYKTKVDFDCYNNLVESSKKQLAEYGSNIEFCKINIKNLF